MNDSFPHRVLWPQELLQRHKVGGDTMLFLSSVGLPEFVPGMTMEFGLFDSEGPDLIIGQDEELPIYVDSTTDAVFEAGSAAEGPCFLNSSVRQLDQFIQAIILSAPAPGAHWSA